jgi:hypothetical protein
MAYSSQIIKEEPHAEGFDNGEGVAVAADGGAYVVGGTNSFGTGTMVGDFDAFVLKFAANGAVVWQRTWGTARTDRSSGRTSSLLMSR